MNARFWTYLNGSPVKLTMRPGQTVRHFSKGPTDEGWSSEAHTWHFDGFKVVHEGVEDGRDCDGRLTQCWGSVCAITDLRAGHRDDENGLCYPEWKHVSASQRDEFAEAAGY